MRFIVLLWNIILKKINKLMASYQAPEYYIFNFGVNNHTILKFKTYTLSNEILLKRHKSVISPYLM